jgi:hypothetical protein
MADIEKQYTSLQKGSTSSSSDDTDGEEGLIRSKSADSALDTHHHHDVAAFNRNKTVSLDRPKSSTKGEGSPKNRIIPPSVIKLVNRDGVSTLPRAVPSPATFESFENLLASASKKNRSGERCEALKRTKMAYYYSAAVGKT